MITEQVYASQTILAATGVYMARHRDSSVNNYKLLHERLENHLISMPGRFCDWTFAFFRMFLK